MINIMVHFSRSIIMLSTVFGCVMLLYVALKSEEDKPKLIKSFQIKRSITTENVKTTELIINQLRNQKYTKPEENDLSINNIPESVSSQLKTSAGADYDNIIKSEYDWYDCNGEKTPSSELTYDKMYKAANCGSAFYSDYIKYGNFDREVNIGLIGYEWEGSIEDMLSGVSGDNVAGVCPSYPKCKFLKLNSYHDGKESAAHVIIGSRRPVSQSGLINITSVAKRMRRQHPGVPRIMYQREVAWNIDPRVSASDDNLFDFKVGYNLNSDFVSPTFVRRPNELLKERDFDAPFEQRINFGMSVISHCRPLSKRNALLNRLTETLGNERVHRYGRCSNQNREIPKKPLINAKNLMKTYKFYFSFENSVTMGYTTEKLFVPLMLGVVPVYYGAPDVVRITKLKSFINALDFDSPGKLAEYLLYLSNNETAYMEYLAWRKQGADAFTEEYLHLVSKALPPPNMVDTLTKSPWKYHLSTDPAYFHPERRLYMCKLCNIELLTELRNRSINKDDQFHKSVATITSPADTVLSNMITSLNIPHAKVAGGH